MATGKDLRKALKSNELTMDAASKKMRISRGTLYNYVKEKGELGEEIVQNVLESLGIDLNAPVVPFLQQLRDQKNSEDPYMVPYIDVPAQAGYTKAYQQRDYIATLKKYPILPNVEPAGAIWRYFEVQGDSMENPDAGPGDDDGILAGDVILASQVPKDDWGQFSNLNTYVVVTDTELLIKDVDRKMLADKNLWVLLSRNQNYKPVTLEPTEVKQLWVLRRLVRNKAKKHRMYDLEAIKNDLTKNLK
jgi:transcriptional regulator with XRE-family HTH domain